MNIEEENTRYFELVDEFFNRDFTDEELKFFNNKLKERIRSGEELTIGEISAAIDMFYFENGDTLEVGRHNWALVEHILKIDENEFYCLNIWKHDDAGEEYEEQVAKRVVLKPVEVLKWVEVENG